MRWGSCWPTMSLPRRKPLVPLVVETADHVAVPVAENGRERPVLDALGDQERALGAFMPDDVAGEAHGFERRPHLFFDIGVEHGCPLGVLALGLQGDAAGEIFAEGAGVKVVFSTSDSGVAAHGRRVPSLLPLPR